MNKIYLDNASTSFPKAPGVGAAMCRFVDEVGCNVNRGGYEAAYSAAETVLDTRRRLCALLGFSHPQSVIFTGNVTTALNMVLKGALQPGDHVLTTSMEHNAVIRPLTQLTAQGVAVSRIPCDAAGRLLLEHAEALVRPSTRLLVMTHASNVCGTLLPAREAGEFCRRHGLLYVLDCAQTAGAIPVEADDWGVDALCFTGHKGLLGPQGVGGFLLNPKLAGRLTPLVSGGTGSFSDSEAAPAILPDRFEAGTLNLPGIFGLNAALRFLEERGVEAIRTHEAALTERLTAKLLVLPCVRVLGEVDARRKAPVVSIDAPGRDLAELAFRLDSEYGIMTRCGLHCAPGAHRTLGTFPHGTVRFSMGWANTEDEVDAVAEALRKLLTR